MKTKKEGKKCNFKLDKKTIIIAVIIIVAFIIGIIAGVKERARIEACNTISNIRNYGYTVSDGKCFYYVSPDDKGLLNEIQKTKKDGKEKTTLYSSLNALYSLNVYEGYIYFIENDSVSFYTTEDLRDNRIYRIKTDGSMAEPQLINDNDFHNSCAQIYVLNDKVYYLGTDSKLYAMGIDGQNRELVSDKVSDYLAITKEYIIHDVKREDSADKETHIMKIDGYDDKAVIEKTKINTVAVVEDYIYYTTGDKEIFRTKIGSGEAELVYDIAAYNFNVSNDGYIYFFGYEDVEAKKYTICLFRVKTDGTSEKAELLYKLADNSDYLNVVNGQAFFMDEEGSKSFIRMVDVDSKEVKNIFEYKKPAKTEVPTEIIDETSGKYTAENPTGDNLPQESDEN